MAFPDSVKSKAYTNAKGKCERCGKSTGMASGEFHHKVSVDAGGSDGLANCEFLCLSCHKKTKSYGGY